MPCPCCVVASWQRLEAELDSAMTDIADIDDILQSTEDKLGETQDQIQSLLQMLSIVTEERDRAVHVASLQKFSAQKAIDKSMKNTQAAQAAQAAKFAALQAELDLAKQQQDLMRNDVVTQVLSNVQAKSINLDVKVCAALRPPEAPKAVT
eukprot:6125848-Pyramimonas_sp.AAC.1